MNEKKVIDAAEQFLNDEKISFVRPRKIISEGEGRIEVVFLVPEIFDEKVAVVDPPDVRVNIDLITLETYLIVQM